MPARLPKPIHLTSHIVGDWDTFPGQMIDNPAILEADGASFVRSLPGAYLRSSQTVFRHTRGILRQLIKF
jgi:hypothetical protein